jgi:hypothetical protein
MNASKDQDYHQARETDERRRARLAVDPAARSAHSKLAAMHAAKAAKAHGHSQNQINDQR